MASSNPYPFRLGTTSFIYPDGYVANVRALAPRVDEIELLIFEIANLPTRHQIRELAALARDHETTFNVHLPLDISMADPSADQRARSVDAVARTIERVAPLAPTTHTLHLTCASRRMDARELKAWQDRATQSTARLLQTAAIASREISVETLEFDPQWLAPVVSKLDLAVCIDVGHLILYGFDVATTLKEYAQRITIFHLHGVKQGRDHRAITHLAVDIQRLMAKFLINFHGSLSIEVFSANPLERSLEAMPAFMAHAGDKSG